MKSHSRYCDISIFMHFRLNFGKVVLIIGLLTLAKYFNKMLCLCRSEFRILTQIHVMDVITTFKHNIIICTVLFDRKTNILNKAQYYWMSIILSGVFDII